MSQTTTPAVDRRRERFSIEQIEAMVHGFYASVRDDQILGPVFNARIEAWPQHMERMVLFWRAVLRSEGTFTMSPRGAPPTLHRAMDEVSLSHYERWLSLFGTVVDDIFEPDAAEEVKDAASRIVFAFSRYISPDNTSAL